MCCADDGVSITDHVLRLAKTCPSGAAALAMAVLPQIQEHMGQAATLEGPPESPFKPACVCDIVSLKAATRCLKRTATQRKGEREMD